MPKVKLEHIDGLSKGQKSGIKIGSRAVPHHLYAYEREAYERALKQGYLIIDSRSRPNLENLWMLVCQSRESECIILHREAEKGIITSDALTIFDGSLADAKTYLKNLNIIH